jgi:hypothetical protein
MFNAPGALLVVRTLTDAPDRRGEPRQRHVSWRPAGARVRTAPRLRAADAMRVASAQRT